MSVSDRIKASWDLLYYVQVMSLLDRIASGDKNECLVSPDDARSLSAALSKFAYIEVCKDERPVPGPETLVNVTLFTWEHADVNRLVGWMLAGMVDGYKLPISVDGSYTDALMAKADDLLERRREERERCLDAIRAYVAEQEAAGKKIVKKHVAEMGFSQWLVRMMWQQFDAERSAAAAASAPPSEEDGRTDA